MIGTNSNGVNAYFIRKEYFVKIKKKDKNIKKFSSKFRESRSNDNSKSFLRGIKRMREIENIKFIDLDKKIIPLKKIKRIYSNSWNNLMIDIKRLKLP